MAMPSHPPTVAIVRAPFVENQRLLRNAAALAIHSPAAPQRAIARDLFWTLAPQTDDANVPTEGCLLYTSDAADE